MISRSILGGTDGANCIIRSNGTRYKTLKNTSWTEIFNILILIIMVASCAAPVRVEKEIQQPVMEQTPMYDPFFKTHPLDVEYLRHGIALIAGVTEGCPDYTRAKIVFEALLSEYPNSKWKESTTALIRIVGDLQSCVEKEKSAYNIYKLNLEEEKSLLQENERLKRTKQSLQEKFNSEITKLVQENERLKKDIELLKDLEIKLDKRERLLK